MASAEKGGIQLAAQKMQMQELLSCVCVVFCGPSSRRDIHCVIIYMDMD